jgi:flagellar biosynthesis/type III secretory pathway chaperone
LLAEETQALDEIEQLLKAEYDALVAKNVATLEEAAETRRGRIGALVRIEEERRSLCRMLGHSADPAGVLEMMKWCDPQGTLTARWKDRGERAKRCRDLNDRNGALVTARLKRVETLVGMITGKDQSAATYGPKGGGYQQGNASGRLLSAEA